MESITVTTHEYKIKHPKVCIKKSTSGNEVMLWGGKTDFSDKKNKHLEFHF